jgi:hypothetical protein
VLRYSDLERSLYREGLDLVHVGQSQSRRHSDWRHPKNGESIGAVS